MKISFHTAQAETHKHFFQQICHKKGENFISHLIELNILIKIRNFIFVMIMPKNIKLAHLFFLLIITGLLIILFPILHSDFLFIEFIFFCP